MKQKLICLTHTISKFHTKKLCKMMSLIIISMFLLSSCFSKPSSSDKTTAKETKQERQAREKKENITELLKEQANTSSSSIKKRSKNLMWKAMKFTLFCLTKLLIFIQQTNH